MKRGSRAKRRAVAAVLLSVLSAMPAFAGAGTWTRVGKTWKYITGVFFMIPSRIPDTGSGLTEALYRARYLFRR